MFRTYQPKKRQRSKEHGFRKRLRPFARRRARTLRPFAVLILLRKPCSLERWRFLG